MSQRRNRLSFHCVNIGVEALESRVVPSRSPASVLAHVASASSSSHDSSSHSGTDDSTHADTHLSGALTSSNPAVTATGNVSFETEGRVGSTSTEFKVVAAGLTPATSYDVAIDGVVVGQLRTNSLGAGKLEFETGSVSHPLPASFPTVSAGSVVTVGTDLSATLAARTTPTPPTGTGGGSTEHPPETHSETHLRAALSDASGATALAGQAEYETETEGAVTVSSFKVNVNHGTPGATLDVQVNGVPVGSILVSPTGKGSLVFSSRPVAGRSVAFPADFPSIVAGSTITVGTASGSFAAPVIGTPGTEHPPETHTETHLAAAFSAPAGSPVLRGQAEYESETEHGLIISVLQINVSRATAGATLDVQINGTSVGTILVDASGKGSLVFSTMPVAGRSVAFPAGFPAIAAGSTITVGGVAVGTFAAH